MSNKSYLRYEPELTFGCVASQGPVRWLNKGMLLATAAQQLIAWKPKTKAKAFVLTHGDAEASAMSISDDGTRAFVGHTDGSVTVWNLEENELVCQLDGHKSPVLGVAASQDGGLVISAGADSDVVVWDVVAEAGLFRLKGHRDAVTCVALSEDSAQAITGSKDGTVRLWDLEQQRCVQTLACHRSEVWSVAWHSRDGWLVSGGADSDLQLSRLEQDQEGAWSLKGYGPFSRAGTDRVARLQWCAQGHRLMCQTNDKNVQLMRLRSDVEATHKAERRRKREKSKKNDSGSTPIQTENSGESSLSTKASDWIDSGMLLTCHTKIRHADVIGGGMEGDYSSLNGIKIAVSTADGRLEVHSSNTSNADAEDGKDTSMTRQFVVEAAGHRSDVRAVCLSKDDQRILSVAGTEAKFWTSFSGQLTRTVEVGPAICARWAHGDRYALVGCKTGEAVLLDSFNGEIINRVEAHQGPVWSIAEHPSLLQFATAGADKKLSFWSLGTAEDGNIVMQRSTEIAIADSALAVDISAQGKYVSVALLDNTLRVFFMDSFKLFLSLYGHRLPVLCCHTSSDERLMVSGSADKNVRIWGLDFGDCHKSLFAHDDSVMAVQFVKKTHLFFSAGKDKTIKYWDGDTFECIMVLNGHLSEIWGLSVSGDGETVVTGSHDRTIRTWKRSDEPVFPEEERQNRLEAEMEKDTVAELAGVKRGFTGGNEESDRAGRVTRDTVEAASRLSEALELLDHETKRRQEWLADCAAAKERKNPEPEWIENPILLGLDQQAYLIRCLKSIRASCLEQAVLVLPFETAAGLLLRLCSCLQSNHDVELCVKSCLLIVSAHDARLALDKKTAGALEAVRKLMRSRVASLRNKIGSNVAGLRVCLQYTKDSQLSVGEANEANDLQDSSALKDVMDPFALSKRGK